MRIATVLGKAVSFVLLPRALAAFVLFGALSAWSQTARADVIAYWTFDVDGSDSTGRYHGTLEGDATITTGGGGIAGGQLR